MTNERNLAHEPSRRDLLRMTLAGTPLVGAGAALVPAETTALEVDTEDEECPILFEDDFEDGTLDRWEVQKFRDKRHDAPFRVVDSPSRDGHAVRHATFSQYLEPTEEVAMSPPLTMTVDVYLDGIVGFDVYLPRNSQSAPWYKVKFRHNYNGEVLEVAKRTETNSNGDEPTLRDRRTDAGFQTGRWETLEVSWTTAGTVTATVQSTGATVSITDDGDLPSGDTFAIQGYNFDGWAAFDDVSVVAGVGGECRGDRIVVEQPGRETFEVTPLTSEASVESFYSYGDPDGTSANTGLEREEVSQLLFHDGPEGRSLVVIHDAPSDGNGGEAVFEFEELPEDGSWIVQDDPGPEPDVYGSDRCSWEWGDCCSDGGVYRGGFDELTDLTVSAHTLEGIDELQVLSAGVETEEGPRRVTVDPAEPITFTFQRDREQADGTAREYAEQFAPNFRFDEHQPWFPTDFEQYVNENRFEDDRTVVDGFHALDGYTSQYEENGAPPKRTVYYNVVGVTDPEKPLEENDLVDVQYWMYYAFDQFTVNFHWHDMEHVHFFVDTERMEPVLYVASTHGDMAVNNEYLVDDGGEVSLPATILPELGSHASATDLNGQRGSFERYGGEDLDPDVTNGTELDRHADLATRLRYWELDADLEMAVDMAFRAYGLPRYEHHGELKPVIKGITGSNYKMPELNDSPVYEHEELPNVGQDDLISREPGRPVETVFDRSDGIRFGYRADSSGEPYDYELDALDQYEDRYVDSEDEDDKSFEFWGPALNYDTRIPGVEEVDHHLSFDWTRTVDTAWKKDAYSDPTQVIDHIPHKMHLEDEYDLDILTPVEQQIWGIVLDIRERIEEEIEEKWEDVEEFLEDLTEYPQPVREALEDLETELDAYRDVTEAELRDAQEAVEAELENVGDAVSEVDDLDAESLGDGLESIGDAVASTGQSKLDSFQPDVDGVVDDGEDFIDEHAPDIDYDPPSVSDVKDGVSGILSSETRVVPASNGVIAATGVEPGEHRLVVEAEGMAPYATYFTLKEDETQSLGGQGGLCLVPDEQAVKVAGESETDELAGVTVEEDFAGTVYDSEVRPDGTFATYVPRSGKYSVEVRDTDDATATYRVDPDEDTDVVRFENVETEADEEPPAPAFAWPNVTFEPEQLVAGEGGDPLVAHLSFDRPVDLESFDPATVDLNGVDAVTDEDHDLVAEPIVERDGERTLAVLFARTGVVDALATGTHDARITGEVGETIVRGGTELVIEADTDCGGTEEADAETLVDGQTVCDLDDDGSYRDVTGDGTVGQGDVAEFFSKQHRDAWKRPELFDFSGNGAVTHGDVVKLADFVALQ